ncbi:hypothetical protein MATL_G00255320 [Megalops atlanticus]|uniref:Uncharacterized protein n=1 Tax=Megalops atlanticus TaxID=7932 RepID=A0A9D3P9T9_MEGAT|nr:hypothetical protein MATL_G00255320 [Megalops atlanticus]
MAALESNCFSSVEETTRERRAHNPKIAEAVRRLHNSEANCRRYEVNGYSSQMSAHWTTFGQNADKYEAAKRHFKAHLMPQVRLLF